MKDNQIINNVKPNIVNMILVYAAIACLMLGGALVASLPGLLSP